MMAKVDGIKAKHARVSPTCQANKTTIGAGHEAIMLLMEEYKELAALEVNANANFHFVLTVERPRPTSAHTTARMDGE